MTGYPELTFETRPNYRMADQSARNHTATLADSGHASTYYNRCPHGRGYIKTVRW